MRPPPRGRFFYRLLAAFLAAGLLPAATVALALGLASRAILERSLAQGAESAADFAAGGLRSVLDAYAALAVELAGDPAVIDYLASAPEARDARKVAEVNRRLYAASREGRVAIYVVPAEGPALGSSSVPAEYAGSRRPGAAILDTCARAVRENTAPRTFGAAVVSGRIRRGPDDAAVFSVGRAVPATPRPQGPAGYVVVDLHRLLLEELFSGAKDVFASLNVRDAAGLVLFDLGRADREGLVSAEGPRPAADRAYVDSGSAAIVAEADAGYGMRLGIRQSMAPLTAQSARLRRAALSAALISAVLAAAMALVLSRSISGPIRRLASAMGRVEDGELHARLDLVRDDELGYLVSSFNRMVARIEGLMDETVEQQRLLRVAEAKALQARIDPHFLYNTLNSIKALARLRGADEIALVATRLGRLLRAGFAPGGEFCTLKESLDLVRAYLEIEAVRYPDRFEFRVDADEALLGAELPRLALQPLAENAIAHGLEPSRRRVRVLVSAALEGPDLVVAVEDDGAGASPERFEFLREALARAAENSPADKPAPGDAGTPDEDDGAGIALANIQRRLRLYYGAGAGLEISPAGGGGFRAALRLPYREKE